MSGGNADLPSLSILPQTAGLRNSVTQRHIFSQRDLRRLVNASGDKNSRRIANDHNITCLDDRICRLFAGFEVSQIIDFERSQVFLDVRLNHFVCQRADDDDAPTVRVELGGISFASPSSYCCCCCCCCCGVRRYQSPLREWRHLEFGQT